MISCHVGNYISILSSTISCTYLFSLNKTRQDYNPLFFQPFSIKKISFNYKSENQKKKDIRKELICRCLTGKSQVPSIGQVQMRWHEASNKWSREGIAGICINESLGGTQRDKASQTDGYNVLECITTTESLGTNAFLSRFFLCIYTATIFISVCFILYLEFVKSRILLFQNLYSIV